MATLIALDQRLGIQLQLRDPTILQSAQLGACQGDSGGPAFAMRDDLVIVGVVSAGAERCGDLTLVTPTAAYYDWIVDTARKLGSPIER
jgi:secreted trypsin-like serine protease